MDRLLTLGRTAVSARSRSCCDQGERGLAPQAPRRGSILLKSPHAVRKAVGVSCGLTRGGETHLTWSQSCSSRTLAWRGASKFALVMPRSPLATGVSSVGGSSTAGTEVADRASIVDQGAACPPPCGPCAAFLSESRARLVRSSTRAIRDRPTRPRRSSAVPTRTSPGTSSSSSWSSTGRLPAPDPTSVRTSSTPAARSCTTWPRTSSFRLDTRAYPYLVMGMTVGRTGDSRRPPVGVLHGWFCTGFGTACRGRAETAVSGRSVVVADEMNRFPSITPELPAGRTGRPRRSGDRDLPGRPHSGRDCEDHQVRDDRDRFDQLEEAAAFDTCGQGRHAGAPSGGCSSTRGLYSTSWMRPSKVRCSIISRATSG